MSIFASMPEVRSRARDRYFWRDLALAFVCAFAFGTLGGSGVVGLLAISNGLADATIGAALFLGLSAVVMAFFAIGMLMIGAMVAASPLFVLAALFLASEQRVVVGILALVAFLVGLPMIAAFALPVVTERQSFGPGMLFVPLAFGVCAGQALWRRCLSRRLGPPAPGHTAIVRVWRRVPLWAKALAVLPLMLAI